MPDEATRHVDRSSDQPLVDPEFDLLGIARHAKVLAEHMKKVPTPFTIGVYGEWGAGKTTFVNFVQYYLDHIGRAEDRPAFVHFEAWEYRNADELWRALTLEIARAVFCRCHADFDPAKALGNTVGPTGEEPRSWSKRLADDAVILKPEQPVTTANDQFREIVAKLDSTMYGGISKRTSSALRLDNDQAVAAAVKSTISALGAFSSVLGWLRPLFGGSGGSDKAVLSDRHENETTRKRVESRWEFKKVLRDDILSRLTRQGQPAIRLCVFLDDLDRCMPDMVLDLLEAITMFLDLEPVVFVVAADETLIGKALRLRYKELLDAGGSEPERDFLARKGQEYFEKIIQLRVNLPECTPSHGHDFIAAQYPEWMPATDVILAAVGSNPRRIKQYCSWLAFRHSVDLAERAES